MDPDRKDRFKQPIDSIKFVRDPNEEVWERGVQAAKEGKDRSTMPEEYQNDFRAMIWMLGQTAESQGGEGSENDDE